MRHLTILAIALVFLPAVAQQPYRQEIIENIIDPCYRMSVRSRPELLKYATEDEALRAIKQMAASNIEDMVNTLGPMIPELDVLIGRERVYEMGLGACIKGVLQDGEGHSSAPIHPGFEKAAITRPTPDMIKEFRSIVENSSPYIERAGLATYTDGGKQKIEIFLMVSKNVNGPMARDLGASAVAILENNWPQLETSDYLIDVMWAGNYTSSKSIDDATIAQGEKGRHDSNVTWE